MKKQFPSIASGGLRAIAARANVSIATVSRALADSPSISTPTKEKVRALAEEMGYRPSVALRQALRSTRLRAPTEYRYTVACIATDTQMGEFSRIDPATPGAESAVPIPMRQPFAMWRGLAARAAELGVSLDFFDLRETPPNKLTGILRARNITSAVVYPRAISWADQDGVESLLHRISDFHCVTVGPSVLSRASVTAVGVDLFEAGRLSYLKAWEAGYCRVLFVQPIPAIDPDRRFEAGLRLAASYFDEPTPVQVLNRRAVERWLPRVGPDCCFIGSVDAGRWWPIAKEMAKGGSCPGFIDWHCNLPFSTPGTTGIDQRDDAQGRAAIDLAVAGLDPSGAARGLVGMECLLHPGWIEGLTMPPCGEARLNLLPEHPYPLAEKSRWHHVPLAPVHSAVLEPGRPWLKKMEIPAFRAGKRLFQGIPFLIESTGRSSSSDAPGVALFRSSTLRDEGGPALPKQISLPLRRRATALYFLHACGYVQSRTPFAEYRVCYRGAPTETIPLVPAQALSIYEDKPADFEVGVNIQDWIPDLHRLETEAVRPVCVLNIEGRPGDIAHLYVLEWRNPHPARVIERIEVAMLGDGPPMLVLFAVTVAL